MLQAKRLLAVVVGSHDTQQHELSLKEGEKVFNDYIDCVGDAGDGSHDTQQHELSLKEGDKVMIIMVTLAMSVTLVILLMGI